MLNRIERLNGFLKYYEAVLAVQALGRPGARFVTISDELNTATRVCRKRERVIAAPNARSDNSDLHLLSHSSGSFE
jgi:hypothetical protein